MMHALKSFDLSNLKTAVVMYKAYNNMLPVNLQKLFVHFVAFRKTRNVNIYKEGGTFELKLNQCVYLITGLHYGILLNVNLKVVVIYRFSRHFIKKIVFLITI